jgi:hypothetical protein
MTLRGSISNTPGEEFPIISEDAPKESTNLLHVFFLHNIFSNSSMINKCHATVILFMEVKFL